MRMPAEWERHSRTWVAFPHSAYTLGDSESGAIAALKTWSNVANQASDFEPVSVVVHPEGLKTAKEYLSKQVEIVEIEIDDAWIRDSGPTFAIDEDKLVAIDWVFNGWGAQAPNYKKDAEVAKNIAKHLGLRIVSSDLVNEGGGIHTNGSDTVLLTETVQLGKERNPNWTKEAVEKEIHSKLGTSRAVWIQRGLTRDYEEFGTKGHIDIVACFTPDGRVLFHDQQDASHPDYLISQQVRKVLTDARFELVAIPAPTILRDKHGFVDYSYINHYVLNDAVLLCAFDDQRDKEVQAMLKEIYPGREVRLLDARELFARGGGIHCITQQQPQA